MASAIEDGVTTCPQCSNDLVYRLDANAGGGFRYDVTCPPCGERYFEMRTPVIALRIAA